MVGPDYEPPRTELPEAYREAANETAPPTTFAITGPTEIR